MKKRIRPMVPALGALVLLCAAYGVINWQQGRNAESQALSPENASVNSTVYTHHFPPSAPLNMRVAYPMLP